MKILFVGGGSGGPGSPLIAVAEQIFLKNPQAKFLFVGSSKGPEKSMVAHEGYNFVSISAGKFRRYVSIKNLLTPFEVIIGFFQSLIILKKFQPNVVFGTGSFVQVPLVFAAWVLKIPVVLHQQDVIASLANTICQLCAKNITVTFSDSLKDFTTGTGIFYKKNSEKIILTGNPFRLGYKIHKTREECIVQFKLKQDFPTLLVLGGGTGAVFINELIKKSLPDLAKVVQIIHSTGSGKLDLPETEYYKPFEFIQNMPEAYKAADIVLCRAGLSTITELSNLGKVSIIIPMPASHQEVNAYILSQFKATIVESQTDITPSSLVSLIRKLLHNSEIQKDLIKNMQNLMPKNSAEKVADLILNFSPRSNGK